MNDNMGNLSIFNDAGGGSTAEFVWQPNPHGHILPVFLPFQGCKSRCVYCRQDMQTGIKPGLEGIERQLDLCWQELANKSEKVRELAFYGGTFTCLDAKVWDLCLAFAEKAMGAGFICGFRCSTRPDSLDPTRLEEMKSAGCHTVELGIQSFGDKALALARRGYDRKTCLEACARVRGMPFALGIQLMPGMPGVDRDRFIADVEDAIGAGADFLRFYPCLVLKGSALAKMWQNGGYMPWTLNQALEILSMGLLLARMAKKPVIRIGLAPQDGLDVLAGPSHPCLGSRVEGRALLGAVKKILKRKGFRRVRRLLVPAWTQGHFWGWRRELASAWREIGIGGDNMEYHERNIALVEMCGE